MKGKVAQSWYFGLFILPAFVVYSVFWIIPLFANIPLSLTNWSGLGAITAENVSGLHNFSLMLHDQIFWTAIQHNVVFTIATLILKLVLALAIAILLDRYTKFKSFFRTVFFFPAIMPFIVVAFLWLWIYDPVFGLLNSFLKLVHLSILSHIWLGDPTTALPAIIAVEVWKSVPFFMLIFLAGLQGIPKEFEEAAQIDGANFWGVIRHITIPQLKPVTTVVGALILFDGFRLFDSVYVMTGGGPGYHSTEVLSTYIYKLAFSDFRLGYGSAVSIVLMIIVMILSIIYLKFLSPERAS